MSAAVFLSGCSLFSQLPPPQSTEQRLAAMPAHFAALQAPVCVRWNELLVPFIEAQSDTDAAFALGVVHAHLRLAQIEILKRVSQGRISEMVGPFTVEIDKALRLIEFGRAAPEIYASMPPENQAWLTAYVDGINAYKATLTPDTTPHEMRVFGIDAEEPFTVADSITLSRLYAVDINWLTWFSLLPYTDQPDFDQIYANAVATGLNSTASFEAPDASPQLAELVRLLEGVSKSGSNSAVVSAAHSATGSAWIASDPHLGFSIPNLWVLAGLRSPSYEVVGAMPPGMPAFAFGRTRHLAWGGTNLHGLSSAFVDVSALDPATFQEEPQKIRVRFLRDQKFVRRVTPYGPIISDAELLPNPSGRTLALRWMGHAPSDEFSALLGFARATNGDAFRQAAETFSLPAQNFLYADATGNVGHVIAAHMPKRPPQDRATLFATPEQSDRWWSDILTARILPGIVGQPDGFIASANNRPAPTADYDIGYFFAPDERIRRLQQLLGENAPVDFQDLVALQTDVVSLDAVELIQTLQRLDAAGWDVAERVALHKLTAWDGAYMPNQRAPVQFVAFIKDLSNRIDGPPVPWRDDRRIVARLNRLFGDDPQAYTAEIRAALAHADAVAANLTWGEIHRLELMYLQGMLPFAGDSFKLGSYPVGGSQETLLKTAHDLVTTEHRTVYGAQSRHISNLGDLDANYFVLVGGNDGWPNATNANDQTPLWLRGEYVQLPLSPEAVQQAFPKVTSLRP
ncbi:MAG: penicillin acylase family protein [Opitutales bacterium]